MNRLVLLIRRLTPVALILLTLSCGDEDVSPMSKESLIVMKAEYFGSNGAVDQLIVVTDPDGKVLGTAKATYWIDTPIYATPFAYNGDMVNVYLISSNGSDHFISAFLNLKRGSEFDGFYYEINNRQVEPVQMKLLNVEPFERFTLSTDVTGFTVEQLADTAALQFPLYAEGGRLFSQLVSDGEGRYQFFDIDKQTRTATVDLSAIREPSLKGQIKLDPNVGYSSFRVAASFDEGSDGWGYELYNTWGWRTSQLDVYYPPVSFARYFSYLGYSLNGKQYSEQREGSTLNLDYETIAFNGVVTSADPRQFKMVTSGEFDYYTASYASEHVRLIVFSSARYSEFSIPDFSQIAGLGKFPFSGFTSVNVELVDVDGPVENEKYFRYFTSGKINQRGSKKTVSFSTPIK